MKHFKKMMALIIALVMVVGTLSTMSNALAAELKVDTTITITGLDEGDTVNLYQVLKWVDGEGWQLVSPFNTPAIEGQPDIAKILDVNNKEKVELTKDTVEKLAALAKPAGATNTAVVDDSKTYSYTTTNAPGMYIALVTPAEAGVVYNPIVVSADFSQKNDTNTIDSSEMMGTSEDQAEEAVAKKTKVNVEKEQDVISNDIGDTYNFTVTATIPTYSKSFEDTSFVVTDEMSEYLDLVANTFTVKTTDGATVTPSSRTVVDKAHGWTISFNDTYIKNLAAPQSIVITYTAKLNITKEEAANLPTAKREYNKVTIDFPNDPHNDKSRTVQRTGTREVTFTIDGSVLGHSTWRSTELVKVGLDSAGEPIESMISYSHGEDHAALSGAKFGLYKEKADADAGNANYYTNGVFEGTVTSDGLGLLYIPGLDAGTYYLKELEAPKGYIKDTKTHTIVITPTYTDVEVTEYYKIDDTAGTVDWKDVPTTGYEPYTYTVQDCDSVTITIDGTNENSYSIDLSGPDSSQSTIIKDSAAELANTQGIELPSTGGIGTTVFYVIGAILVIGAGILLVTRRRMTED